MKKLIFIFLALLSFSSYGQAVFDEGVQITGGQPTVTDTPFITSTASDGLQTKILGQNIPIPYVPLNYSVLTPTIGGHLSGLDAKIGTIVATTAGVTTRVWFTADGATVGGSPYYQTQITKGAAASAIQNVTNDDNEKRYFAQDLIGAPFVSATMFPPGVYAGNLSASTSPNSDRQKWTVELYKCNNAGTPISSGVTGAPVGSLGVTVITILDSGELTLVSGSITNVPVSGNLGGTGFSITVGERVRYHVSAEKVGTAGSNITQSVYYGSSYNSYIDVPVPLNTTAVQNLSGVFPATTATEALNVLNTGLVYKKTITQIRALTGVLQSNNFYTTDLGQEGNWYYDTTDTTSSDNTGTILVTADGKRIKRVISDAVNVKWFGAKGDARKITDASVTSGSAIITSATANFTSSDIGKTISVSYAGVDSGSTLIGRSFVSTVLSVTNSTTAVMSANASKSIVASRNITDGAMTVNSSTFTSATANFTRSDIGKKVIVSGAGELIAGANIGIGASPPYAITNSDLDCYIIGYTNSTTVTLSKFALISVSGANVSISGAWTQIGTDDTTGLQNAINGGVAINKKVLIDKGRYLTTATLSAIDNLFLQGYGAGNSVISPVGYDFSAISYNPDLINFIPIKNATFDNFEVDCFGVTTNNYQTKNKGFYIRPAENIKFLNLYVHDAAATGIGCDFMKNYVIKNCIVEHNGRQLFEFYLLSGYVAGGSGIGIGAGLYENESGVIEGCFAINNGGNGIFVEGQSFSIASSGLKISGCSSLWNRWSGFGDFGTEGTIISSNVAKYNTTGISADIAPFLNSSNAFYSKNGIYTDNFLQDNNLSIGVTTISGGQLIADNKILISSWYDSSYGIKISSNTTGSGMKEIKISNNYIYGTKNNGISISGLGNDTSLIVRDLVINSNSVINSGVSPASLFSAIDIKTAVTNLYVTNNICFDERAGGSKTQSYGLSTNGIFTISRFSYGGNNFLNNATGIDNITSATITTTSKPVIDESNQVQIGTPTIAGAGRVIIGGTANAVSGFARGEYNNVTLNATANNDILIGLDVLPSYNVGAFTGVGVYGIRSAGTIIPTADNLYQLGSTALNWANVKTRSIESSSGGLDFKASNGNFGKLFSNGHWTFKNGGTLLDAGFFADFQETVRFNSTVTHSAVPATSAGTPDFLTRNTSTGVVEKIPSANIATSASVALKADIASPTFTGDPKAPTPTSGDNDTSIATTAFVTGAIAGKKSFIYNFDGIQLANTASTYLMKNLGVLAYTDDKATADYTVLKTLTWYKYAFITPYKCRLKKASFGTNGGVYLYIGGQDTVSTKTDIYNGYNGGSATVIDNVNITVEADTKIYLAFRTTSTGQSIMEGTLYFEEF